MKTAIFFLIALIISFTIEGCSDNQGNKTTQSTPLEIGVATEVKSGDMYRALSNDALVTFEQNLTANIRTITLTNGKGELITTVQ